MMNQEEQWLLPDGVEEVLAADADDPGRLSKGNCCRCRCRDILKNKSR